VQIIHSGHERKQPMIPLSSSNKHLLTARQVREFERVVIEEHGIPGSELMERAGKRAFHRIRECYGGISSLLVLCGSGNNGGDGYVVALCALSQGIDVQVVFTGEPKTRDARLMHQRYLGQGGVVRQYNPGVETIPDEGDVIVDAILGIGVWESPRGVAGVLIQDANEDSRPVVALDVPSGLNCDTGVAYSPCIKASVTVSFIVRKIGCHTGDGYDFCGHLIHESLDVPFDGNGFAESFSELVVPWELPPRIHNSHKRSYGDVVIFGGSKGMFGAVLLAGRAAMRAGCGLVTVASTKEHAGVLAVHCPELMSLDLAEHDRVHKLLERADTVVVGPGLDNGVWAQDVLKMVNDYDGPMVVDAGALRLLAGPEYRQKRDNWILTPHPGEAAGLLDCDTCDIQNDRIESAREIAGRYGGICILKGSGTVIANSRYRQSCKICDRGNPGMATAGMGDVLSGILGAFLSFGWPQNDCAEFAVWVHSGAADLAARRLTEYSLVATDVIDFLPAVYRSISGESLRKENGWEEFPEARDGN